jgi:transforming growth factor-beta-induced protein
MKFTRVLSVMLAAIMLLTVASVAFAQDADIVDTAASNDDFSTLVAAVQAADLVDDLKGEGPFTVFAPVNAAFEPFAADGTLDALLADPSGLLTDILLYHVVSGKVMSTDLSDGMTAPTLNGASLTFSVSDEGVMVNDANVVVADIEVSNGVIHVIDSVLLPPADEMEEAEMAEEEMAAPAQMPVTGTGQTALPAPMVVAAALMAVLVGGAIVTRRRIS